MTKDEIADVIRDWAEQVEFLGVSEGIHQLEDLGIQMSKTADRISAGVETIWGGGDEE